MDFTPRYVPRCLPLLLLQDDYSVPLGSALFHPSRERGVLLPLALACVNVNPDVFVGQARSLLCIATIWLELRATEVKTWQQEQLACVGEERREDEEILTV